MVTKEIHLPTLYEVGIEMTCFSNAVKLFRGHYTRDVPVRQNRTLIFMSTYTSYRLAQLVSQRLPRRFAYWVGLRIADRFFARDQQGRRAVMSNLSRILESQGTHASEESLRQMARRNFQYFGKYLVDFFRFSRFQLKDVHRLVSMEHLEYLEEAERLGQGVVLITAHLGNWELGAAILSSLGRRLSAVYFPQRASKINELFQKHRSQRGIHLIPFGHAARGVLKALKNKEHVAMLADRDYTTHHDEPILFFGRPARLPSGPARIAIKTGCPVVPTFLVRQEDDTFRLRFHPPIIPTPKMSVEQMRLRVRDALESEIARNPLQWFMFDDFWELRNHHEPSRNP